MKEKENLTCVYTGTLMEINWISELLKESEIESTTRNRSAEAHHSGFASAAPDQIEIYVYESNAAKAIELISANKNTEE